MVQLAWQVWGVTDSYLRLLGAHSRGTRSFFKQDLSHFFDSLSLEVLVPLLEHYRAPPALVQLVTLVGSLRFKGSLLRTSPVSIPELCKVALSVHCCR